jgi:hypothetical protein
MANVTKLINWAGAILFAVMTFVSIAFFSQKGDISHTVLSSYAYLQGHFIDFYDFNLNVVGGNSYLPTVYVIFAVWMLPLFVMGLTSTVDLSSGVIPKPLEMSLLSFELLWAKLALILAFLISIYIFRQLASKAFGADRARVWLTTASFGTAPLAFFAVGIFNQYDVFSVLFTLLGLLFLVDRKYFRFAIFFGLAISLKFFAVLLVVPLILYFVPAWSDRFKTSLALFAVPVSLSLPYLTSDAFRSGVLFLVTDRATNPSFAASLSFTVVLYFAIVFWSWRARSLGVDPYKFLSLVGLGIYAILFNSVFFHPQWLIIMTPFIALAVGYIRNVATFLWLETLGFMAFTWYTVNMWALNVDSVMILNGPWSEIFGTQPLPLSVFYPVEQSELALLAFKVLLLILFAYPFAFEVREKIHLSTAAIRIALWFRAIAPLLFIICPSMFAVGITS